MKISPSPLLLVRCHIRNQDSVWPPYVLNYTCTRSLPSDYTLRIIPVNSSTSSGVAQVCNDGCTGVNGGKFRPKKVIVLWWWWGMSQKEPSLTFRFQDQLGGLAVLKTKESTFLLVNRVYLVWQSPIHNKHRSLKSVDVGMVTGVHLHEDNCSIRALNTTLIGYVRKPWNRPLLLEGINRSEWRSLKMSRSGRLHFWYHFSDFNT